MTEKLASKLASIAEQNAIIKAEDYELHIYSYQILLERTLSWGSILLVSIFFETLPYTLAFAVFFGGLRMFVGGWHASSFLMCFLYSFGMFFGFSLIEKFLIEWLSLKMMMTLIVVCGLLIGLLGPVANANKPIRVHQYRRCRCISIIVLIAEILLSFILYNQKNKKILLFILLSFLINSSSLLTAHRNVNRM